MTIQNVNVNNLYPNLFHSDKWQCNFSNIPTINDVSEMKYFDNYVKTLTFPDYNMGEIFSDFRGFRIRHPAEPRPNIDLSQIQIEFKLSEDMKNYLYCFEWMRRLKHGELPETYTDLFRKYTVKKINVTAMDNKKRPIAIWTFSEAFLLSISSLPLTTGTSDEITFTVNMSYQEILFTPQSIMDS